MTSYVPPVRLAFLAIMNFVLDTGAFVGHSQSHIAYGAHVGGFLGGALCAMVISTFTAPSGATNNPCPSSGIRPHGEGGRPSRLPFLVKTSSSRSSTLAHRAPA